MFPLNLSRLLPSKDEDETRKSAKNQSSLGFDIREYPPTKTVLNQLARIKAPEESEKNRMELLWNEAAEVYND